MALISVIIPAYNAERYLREAVDSVLAQVEAPALEIIIGTAPSTDGTTALARALPPPVRCVEVQGLGDAIARNTAIRASRGERLAFIDADDRWAPNKLALQLACMAQQPQLEAVSCITQNFQSPDWSGDIGKRTAPGEALLPGTLLITRSAFLRVGHYDQNYRVGSVVDWALRAREAGLRCTILKDVLLHRRVHEDNMGHRERAHAGDYARALKASLDRRRQQQDDSNPHSTP